MSNLASPDLVLLIDKFQNRNNSEAIACPHGHGLLTAHKSGAHLLCGRGQCEVAMSIDSELIERAEAYVKETSYGAPESGLVD